MTGRWKLPLPTSAAATAPEPSPLTTEALIAKAHASRQGVPYETAEQLLTRLPERLRALADYVLSGKANAGDGVPQDRREAYLWYARAAAQGEPEAAVMMAGVWANLSAEERELAPQLFFPDEPR